MARLFKELPFNKHPDLTPYLIHLTRNSERENKNSALDNLISILKTGKIWGSDASGYIKGPNTASCFMDVPFMSLKGTVKSVSGKTLMNADLLAVYKNR